MPLSMPPRMGGSRPLGNIPKNIGKIGVPSNIGRAANTSVSKLTQRVDRDNSKVSINQLLSAKAEERGQRTTSINRIGVAGTTAHTSASRYQTNIKTSANDQGFYNQNSTNETAEENRANYVRQLIRKRKAKERNLLIKKLKGT